MRRCEEMQRDLLLGRVGDPPLTLTLDPSL
jgi:hypothetical protein